MAVHAVRKLKGHKADARLEACISEEHVHEFCHFSFDGVGTVGDDGVVGAGVRFFRSSIWPMTESSIQVFTKSSSGHSTVCSTAIPRAIFRFGIVVCRDSIGGGKAGGMSQCVI